MNKTNDAIKRIALAVVAFVGFMSMNAIAQEFRSEISAQGTGLFTKDSDGNGVRNQATKTGGLLVGYRYNFARWLAAEANYGYSAGGSFAGVTRQTKGAFVYGGAADYGVTKRISLREEYRGYVYKAPDFDLTSLKTDAWTHVAQPSAGVVYHF